MLQGAEDAAKGLPHCSLEAEAKNGIHHQAIELIDECSLQQGWQQVKGSPGHSSRGSCCQAGAASHLTWELGEEGNIHLLALGCQTFKEGLAGALGVIHSWLVALQEHKGPELIPLWHWQQPKE